MHIDPDRSDYVGDDHMYRTKPRTRSKLLSYGSAKRMVDCIDCERMVKKMRREDRGDENNAMELAYDCVLEQEMEILKTYMERRRVSSARIISRKNFKGLKFDEFSTEELDELHRQAAELCNLCSIEKGRRQRDVSGDSIVVDEPVRSSSPTAGVQELTSTVGGTHSVEAFSTPPEKEGSGWRRIFQIPWKSV
jgi:hypothetical protein